MMAEKGVLGIALHGSGGVIPLNILKSEVYFRIEPIFNENSDSILPRLLSL